ncbi:MAG TPA: histidine phosphatase family protein [Candidatus Moranbacteria bacterium]|nr:histidine phosphatase family protein [Candidatus Moranbacteria bacterium]HRZ33389.1 histidine phosphatase family protein [Candidatus Moranbacteria bacterium]
MEKSDTVFIAIRHGSYDDSRNLSERGREQMIKVAQQIKEMNVNNFPVTLICSTAPRAQQGGQLIAEELGIPAAMVIFKECLWEDNGHFPNIDEVKKLLDENLRENTILLGISHLDLVPALASHVAKKFGHKGYLSETSYGQGWLVSKAIYHPFPK